MKPTLCAVAVLCAILAPITVSAKKNGSKFGVTIVSCTVNSKDNQTNGINIVYYNSNDSTATEVDFLVNYGGHKYVMIDKGHFSRGAQINHNLTNALTGQPFDGPTPKRCAAQRVYLEDGNVLQ
jgi:hypothetical protein